MTRMSFGLFFRAVRTSSLTRLQRAVRTGSLPVKISNHQGWATVEFNSPHTTEVSWNVSFASGDVYHFPVREPQNLWAERAGIDGANLRWTAQHQPAVGYQVWLNGKSLGFTPAQLFALRELDAAASYTAEVKAIWQDGTISEKKAELTFSLKQLLPDEVYLSELDPLRQTPGWRQAEFNRNFNGGGLSIAGRPFEKGIGMPTNSEIEFELNGTYNSFSALVGIDDEHNNKDSIADFVVLGDGKELWRSGGMKKADGVKSLKVDVRDVGRLIAPCQPRGRG